MRAPAILAGLLLAFAALSVAAPVHATAFCSDALTPASCDGLLCIPNPHGGYRICSSDPIIVCVKDPCPGLP